MTVDASVIDASPLILYSRIGRLDLIEDLAPTVAVPESVIEEVRTGMHKDRAAIQAIDWATRFRVADVVLPISVER